MTMITNLGATKERLKADFIDTARWREDRAVEYPNDARNLEAVKLLKELATTVDQVDPTLLNAYAELWDAKDPLSEVEEHQDMLRTIGFQWAPDNATEFVTAFIRKMTSVR
jgi:hypothetical protein